MCVVITGVLVGVPVTGAGVSVGVGVFVLHGLSAVEVLRGLGAPAVKSALLLSVSLQPPPACRHSPFDQDRGAWTIILAFVQLGWFLGFPAWHG